MGWTVKINKRGRVEQLEEVRGPEVSHTLVIVLQILHQVLW